MTSTKKETTDYTMIRSGAVRQRMQCDGATATRIEKTFVTVEQLLDAVESDDPLTDIDGIGPATADVINDWYEHREEREANARESTATRTSSKTLSISFHGSWAEPLGIDEVEDHE